MRDIVHEYVEQLLDAKADDEETPAARQSRISGSQVSGLRPARQALADYRTVDELLRSSPLLPVDIELRLSHTVSLWNLAFDFLPK